MTVVRIARHCNERCVFCNISSEDGYNQYYETLEDVQRYIDERKPRKKEIIEISGGEPTLNPKLPEIVRLFKKNGYRMAIDTNAVRFADYNYTRTVTREGLSDAFVSLHAANAELSESITGCKDTFDKTIKGIDNLIANNIDVTINFVWFSQNKEHLPDFARFLRSRFGGKVELHLSVIAPNFTDRVEDFIFPISEGVPVLLETIEICEKIGLNFKVADICGIPLCFIKGHENIYVDPLLLFVPPVRGRIRDKVKGLQCRDCVHFNDCAGVVKEYAMVFGTDELVPVTTLSTKMRLLYSAARSPITLHALRFMAQRLKNNAIRETRFRLNSFLS